MGAKSRDTAQPPSPEVPLPRVPPDVVLSLDDASRLQALAVAALEAHGPRPLGAFARAVSVHYESAQGVAARWPWEHLSNAQLVHLLRARHQARVNAYKFMSALGGTWAYTREAVDGAPEQIVNDLPIPDAKGVASPARVLTFPRRWLYLTWLRVFRRSMFLDDILLHAAAGWACGVIDRRLSGHPGGAAAARLFLMQRWLEGGRDWAQSEGDRFIVAMLGRFRTLTIPHVPPAVRRRVAGAMREELDQAVDAQAWQAINERLDGKDTFAVIEEALAGRLDILPQATAHDLIDQRRRSRRRAVGADCTEELSVVFEEATMLNHQVSFGSTEGDPRTSLGSVELLESFLAANPGQRANAQTALARNPPKGITDRAIRLREAKLRGALGAAPRPVGRPRKKKGRPSARRDLKAST